MAISWEVVPSGGRYWSTAEVWRARQERAHQQPEAARGGLPRAAGGAPGRPPAPATHAIWAVLKAGETVYLVCRVYNTL